MNPLKNKPLGHRASVRVRLALGEVYLILGYGERAAQEYQGVLDLQSQDPYLGAVAQFELGCALYAKQDWQGAVDAYDAFLAARPGQTLIDKDQQWKSQRPGYLKLVAQDPEKVKKLTGLELVPDAAYWKAEALRRLKRYSEAKEIADSLLASFPNLTIGSRVEGLSKWCAGVNEEGM